MGTTEPWPRLIGLGPEITMAEQVDLLEQAAKELSQKAEKETNAKERKQLLDLAQRYRARAEKLRNGIDIDFVLAPKIQPKSKLQSGCADPTPLNNS
jgi:hypothetical protein